jgi:hypothetical protein
MNSFNAGEWVWMPDKEDVVVAAEVVESFMPGQQGSLRLDSGEVRCSPNLICARVALNTSCRSCAVSWFCVFVLCCVQCLFRIGNWMQTKLAT